jgi:hypothetical protein
MRRIFNSYLAWRIEIREVIYVAVIVSWRNAKQAFFFEGRSRFDYG